MGTGLLLLPFAWAGPVWAHAWQLLLAVLVIALWWKSSTASGTAHGVSLFGMVVGTPLLFYGLFGPFFSHIASFIVVTAFLVLWSKSREDCSPCRWLNLGLLLGLATLVRPQNIMLGVVFLADISHLAQTARRSPSALLKNMFLPALLGLMVGLAPRFPAYAVLYGSPLALPKLEEMRWFSPHITKTLFSDYHGILPWTPIYLLAIAGLAWGLKIERRLCGGLLLVFLVQFYINAANEVWWSGGSFGNRRLTDYSIIVAWGLLFLMASSGRFLRSGTVIAISLCSIWTLTLLLAERRLIVPLDRYVPFNSEGFLRSMADVYLQPRLTWQSLTRAIDSNTKQRILATALLFLALGLTLSLIRTSRPGGSLIAAFRISIMVIATLLIALIAVAAARTPPLNADTRVQFAMNSSILWDNYAELAGYHLTRQEFIQADKAARKAISIRKDGPAAYWYSGIALLNLGKETEAAGRFRQVLDLNPAHSGARDLLKQLENRNINVPGVDSTNEQPASQEADWRVH